MINTRGYNIAAWMTLNQIELPFIPDTIVGTTSS